MTRVSAAPFPGAGRRAWPRRWMWASAILVISSGLALIAFYPGSDAVPAWIDKRLESSTASAPRPAPPPAPVAQAPAPIPPPLGGTASSIAGEPHPLVLVRVTLGRGLTDGIAQLGTDPRNPQTYVGGAVLANGARIAEIHRDHIVLERNGQRASLYTQAATRPLGEADRRALAALLTVGGDSVAAAGPAPDVSTDALSGIVRTQPSFRGGVFSGLEVLTGSNTAAFEGLGLRNGDVVTAINGAALADETQGVMALESLTQGGTLRVTVHRGTEVRELALDGRRLATPPPLPPVPPG